MTETLERVELLPCAYCGCELWLVSDKHDYWGPDGQHAPVCPIGGYDCCEFADKDAAITAWNTRTQSGHRIIAQADWAAVVKLERAATEVHRLGARTGMQWTHLTSALVNARAALARIEVRS